MMKVIKRTATELVFQNVQLSSFFILWAFGFMGPPLFMGYMTIRTSESVTLSCDRVEPKLVNCQSKKTPLFEIAPATVKQYNSVTAAEYKRETTEDGVEHYVELTTKNRKFSIFQGNIFINEVKGNPETALKFANRLNQFLQSNQQSISLTKNVESGVFFALGFLSVFIIIGVFTLHNFVRIITLKLDKNSNQINERVLSILGLWTKSSRLQEIEKIEVEEGEDSDGDLFFRPVIVMESGKKYYLGPFVSKRETASVNVNEVKNFLDLESSSTTDGF